MTNIPPGIQADFDQSRAAVTQRLDAMIPAYAQALTDDTDADTLVAQLALHLHDGLIRENIALLLAFALERLAQQHPR